MGLASGQLQDANEAKAAADAQKQAGISGIIGGVASGLAGGIGGSLMKGIGGKIGGALGKTKLGGALGNLAMQGGARIGEGGFGSGFLSGAGCSIPPVCCACGNAAALAICICCC